MFITSSPCNFFPRPLYSLLGLTIWIRLHHRQYRFYLTSLQLLSASMSLRQQTAKRNMAWYLISCTNHTISPTSFLFLRLWSRCYATSYDFTVKSDTCSVQCSSLTTAKLMRNVRQQFIDHGSKE